MKKLAIFSLVVCLVLPRCFSQALYVQGETGKLFLMHKVVARENWYSVGRLYNISPKEIAPFNNSSLTIPLTIGQELKIPLNETNFSQTGEKTEDESLVPIYHVLQAKDNMYKVSTTYNAVPISRLESWNHLSKEAPKSGTRLIVGYLRIKTALSALASRAKSVAPSPVANQPATDGSTNSLARDNKKTSTTQDRKTTNPPPSSATSSNSASAEDLSAATENRTSPRNNVDYRSNNEGFFIGEFIGGSKYANGTAGTFKSTSGWQDGKFYALMNNVQVGTIIKVIAPATQKSVYAKVLGQLPDMKESEGLTVRISNAAASELGEPEGRFSVQVRY